MTSFTSIRWWLTKPLGAGLLVAFLSLMTVKGQVLQTARYELPVHSFNDGFEIIPAGTNGLFLYQIFNGLGYEQLQLIKLDTAFKEQWGGLLNFEKDHRLIGKRSFNGTLYLLFRYRDYTRNDFILYSIVESNGDYESDIIRGFIPFAPSEFHVTDRAVLIGGYFNRVPVVLHYSLVSQQSKVLPGLFNESGELTQVKTYRDGSFDVLISARNYLKQRTVWIKNYGPEGELLRNLALNPEEQRHLIFGRAMKTDQNMQLVAGVYGTRSAEFSRGMFIASIDPSGMEQIRYYNFADLENFFKYMKAKREKRVKSRIDRKKVKGKRIRFNYRFLVHELIPYNDNFILLGEAFYPKYITTDRNYGGFFTPFVQPGMITQNGRIFDGYYYTHAVVMCFDQRGKLLWDNSFEINDVKTFTLDQFVKIEADDEKIALFYIFDNEIRTKIIKGDKVLEGKTVDRIRTLREGEIVRRNRTDPGKLEYWYDDKLFAYGVQEIEDPGATVKRRVFYINKVTTSK